MGTHLADARARERVVGLLGDVTEAADRVAALSNQTANPLAQIFELASAEPQPLSKGIQPRRLSSTAALAAVDVAM